MKITIEDMVNKNVQISEESYRTTDDFSVYSLRVEVDDLPENVKQCLDEKDFEEVPCEWGKFAYGSSIKIVKQSIEKVVNDMDNPLFYKLNENGDVVTLDAIKFEGKYYICPTICVVDKKEGPYPKPYNPEDVTITMGGRTFTLSDVESFGKSD